VRVPVLEVRNLSVRFRTGTASIDAVRGVDLDLEPAEVLGVIGESGSGKTVTGLGILRLLPENAEISADRLSFRGSSLLGLTDEEFRALRGTRLAMVFQNPVGSFNPAKTIGWHLERAADRKRGYRDGKSELSSRTPAEWLAVVGVPRPEHVLELYPHQLSGGMLQRALIAMVLLMQPDVVIADEPTTNLDNIVERQIVGLFRQLRTHTRASVMFITHDMSLAATLCDRIAVMYAGEIVEIGPTSDVFNRPRHPYTIGLIETAMQLERRASQLSEIPGELPNAAALPAGCLFAPRCRRAIDACRAARPQPESISPTHSVRCIRHD
jgi:peptide/nickel transport system ATP-binding protein